MKAKDPRRSEAARRAWKTKLANGIKPFDGHQSKGGATTAALAPPDFCPCCNLPAAAFGSRMSWLAHRSGITQTERMGRAAMARLLHKVEHVKTWRRVSNAYRIQHGQIPISGDDHHPDGIGSL